MISKNIYYCWFGGNPKSENVKKNIKAWKEINPEYKIIEINEKNFDYKKYKFSREAYSLKKWAFVSDMARMEVLKEKGGFCLDVDVRLIKPLDKLRIYNGVWGLETAGLINPGLIIGADVNNIDIKNICRKYESLEFDEKIAEKELKSPDIVTDYFYYKGLKKKNIIQYVGSNQLVLSSDYFAPYHWWGGGKITKRTMGIHQYDNSWGANLKVTYEQRIMRNWRCNYPVSYFLCRNSYHFISDVWRR